MGIWKGKLAIHLCKVAFYGYWDITWAIEIWHWEVIEAIMVLYWEIAHALIGENYASEISTQHSLESMPRRTLPRLMESLVGHYCVYGLWKYTSIFVSEIYC